MTDTLREKVAKAKYEQKRARLLEAFGDTAGWPEWDKLKPTLKEIEMEDCDFYIAVVLEEAAKMAQRISDEEAVKCRDAFEEDREMALRHSDTSGGAASVAAAIRAMIVSEA